MSLMSRIIVRSERLSRAPASAGAAAGPPAPTTVAASTARRGVANRVMTGLAAGPWASAASQRASERGGWASGGPSRSRYGVQAGGPPLRRSVARLRTLARYLDTMRRQASLFLLGG